MGIDLKAENGRLLKKKKTRKRAIAKALHLEGHSDFALDILGFGGLFGENIVFRRFAKCASQPPCGAEPPTVRNAHARCERMLDALTR